MNSAQLESTTLTLRLVETEGPYVAGRARAELVRSDVVRAVGDGQPVVIDLEAVRAMSPSFAHELFAKLPPGALGDVVRIANARSEIEALIEYVARRRRAAPE